MSTPVVLQPDVEEILTGYLLPKLQSTYPSVVVSNQYGGGDCAVWVRRDGGRRLDALREQMTVGVNCYGPDRATASVLARQVVALLVAAPNGTPVLRVDHTSGPEPIEDHTPREFFTCDVITRGTQQTP